MPGRSGPPVASSNLVVIAAACSRQTKPRALADVYRILLANSRRRPISRNLAKTRTLGSANPAFPTARTNSQTVSYRFQPPEAVALRASVSSTEAGFPKGDHGRRSSV